MVAGLSDTTKIRTQIMTATIQTELTSDEKAKVDEWLFLVDAKKEFATFEDLAEMISQDHEDINGDLIFEYAEQYWDSI